MCERACQFGTPEQRTWIIQEIVTPGADGVAPLQAMIKDQYANYVVQKILDVVSDDQRSILVNAIRPLIPSLKRFPYAKHIVSRVESDRK